MQLMNPETPVDAAPTEAPVSMDSPMPMEPNVTLMEDDGTVGDDEYTEDIVTNLEAHLNSLPEQAKEFLATYAVTPEFAAAIGIVNGPVVGDYFMRYVDPSKKVVVQDAKPQAAPAPQPAAPAAPQVAPQAATPAPAPAGGGIMNV